MSGRHDIALKLAVTHSGAVMDVLRDRRGMILRRFSPQEQALVAYEWPTSLRVVEACLPEIIDVLLASLADAFNHRLLDQIEKRCHPPSKPVPNTPSSSSSPASSASS